MGKTQSIGYRNCFRFNLQINQSNVTEIKINYTWSKAYRNNIMIGLINAQSIKGKDLLIKDVLCKDNIDACIILETWLRDNEEDTSWTQTTVLNNNDYKLQISDRKKNRRGGRLALVTKQAINTQALASGTLTSFKYAL